MIRIQDTFLNRICIAAVIFVVGIAAGVILERSISSDDDSTPSTEEIAEIEEANVEDTSATDATEETAPSAAEEESPKPEVKEEEKPQNNNESEEKPTTPSEVKSIGSYESLSADEKADLKYLKENDAWASSKVKSQRFKDMFTQLNNGNIDCIVNIFSSIDKDYVNGYAIKIANAIPKLSSEEREKAKKLLCEDKGESIKLSWAAKKIGDMAK